MTDEQRLGDEADDDALVSRLARLGAQPVDVSVQRLDAIEQRVRASAESHDSDAIGPPIAVLTAEGATGTLRRSASLPRAVLAAASILAVLALSVALLGSRDDALLVAAADDATIFLPDGGSVVATDGTEVPDDSIVHVSGFLQVGDRRYGPGRYRVDGGRLVALVDTSQVPNTDDDTGAGAVPSAGDPTVAERPRPGSTIPDAGDRPPVSSSRTTTSPTRPATTRVPTRPATTTPSRTTVADRISPERTEPRSAPTTTEPRPTRPPSTDRSTMPPPTTAPPTAPSTTVARPTTTTTTTTTTTIVRRRPAFDDPARDE